MQLFSDNELSHVLDSHVQSCVKAFERKPEDEILSRSTDDLVEELVSEASIHPLTIGEERVDGSVKEARIDVSSRYDYYGTGSPGYEVTAVYEFSGDPQLFKCRPSTRLLASFDATIGNGVLTITKSSTQQTDAQQVDQELSRQIGQIRTMAQHSKTQVDQFNAGLSGQFMAIVEARKNAIQKRRDLAGALGFSMQRRVDAPAPVPLKRKSVGAARTTTNKPHEEYQDEPALTQAQYEDAIEVVVSTMLAMERTPSVASGKVEEDLRDQILVQLNGTFQGAATGETFVQKGKTDLLVRVDDRHVFVGECKWWTGEKAFSGAIDQLLGYLPWRDEKAALILFIDRKDASSVIDKADLAVRQHTSFKRVGKSSTDPSRRRNYVLGHPGDHDREIQLAALFAVLPKD